MTHKHPALVTVFAAFLAASCYSAFADQPVESATEGQEAIIRETAGRYVDALRRGDAQVLLSLWLPDGTYVDATGKSFNAHDLIAQQSADASPQSQNEPESGDHDSTIRFVTSDVAIENGSSSGSGAGGYTAIWVKRGENWLLASLQDRPVADETVAGPLNELSWMIGNWVASTDTQSVECSAQWVDNRRFIVIQYQVDQSNRRVTASQRIGWDPAARRIRSWTFDSDGTLVESQWYHAGDAWIERAAAVLPDGNRSFSVVFWIPEGTDRFVRKTNHTVVGESKAEDSVLEFQRVEDR